MDPLDTRESSLKELPTRELKLKRHRVRRDTHTIPPLRLRLKSNISSLNSEADIDKGLSDRSVSSSPENINPEHSPVYVSIPYNNSSHLNSSPPSPLELNYDLKENSHHTSPTNLTEEDYDQPLDMSRKRPQEAELKESISIQQQQLRPSVITCASALLRTQCSLSDLAHQMCSANVSDCNSNDVGDNQCLKNHQNNEADNIEVESSRPRHRREVVSGSCDPVIDEHFRRSLGKDYRHIFSKSVNNSVSITVDDHFAKALGDTWHQIQQSKNVAGDNVPPHSSQSLQPPKPASFLHQPPEIF